jgi:hypothetical protein
VDEATWLGCTGPTYMIQYLRASGRASERRLRLAACACVRQGAWDLLRDEGCRAALQAREGFEDGLVMEADLKKAQRETWRALVDAFDAHRSAVAAVRAAAEAVGQPNLSVAMRMRVAEDIDQWCANPERMWAYETDNWAVRVFDLVVRSLTTEREPQRIIWAREADRQCELLRCVFGNPFAADPAVAPSVLRWQGGTVPRLAEAAYMERDLPAGTLDPARLAVLADALEDAGCQDPQILEHLRGEGPHVRGCWVTDLLLGRSP